MVAKALWREMFASNEEVSADAFVRGLARFLKQKLHMGEAEVGALLSDENKAALIVAVDLDGNGKVRVGGEQ